MGRIHSGRSWTSTFLEDACPCPKEPCGLVCPADADPDCLEHPFTRMKSMRQGHSEENCPGRREWIAANNHQAGGYWIYVKEGTDGRDFDGARTPTPLVLRDEDGDQARGVVREVDGTPSWLRDESAGQGAV